MIAVPMVKAILFDLDGTLLDTHDLILESMQHAVKTVLREDIPPERLMAKVGQPLSVQMWDFTGDRELHDELLRVYREYNAVKHDGMVRPFGGVEETLDELRAEGYPLGVVTSKRHDAAMQGLQLFGLDGYLNCMIGSDDWPEHKPHPGPVSHGAELLGHDAKECLYVGDSPYDIQAGNGAGCKTAAALWGMFSETVLLAEHPDFACAGIRDVPCLL